MRVLPPSDVARWPQIVLELDAAARRVVDDTIADELAAAGEDIVALARSQIAEDSAFSDVVVNAVKTLAVTGGMSPRGDANA
jgi:hypothetical protein